MNYKKLSLNYLQIALLFLIITVLGFYFYDPYAFFHKNSMKERFHIDDRYGIPHIIDEKINDFNSLILGSSLMRSTDGKWLQKDGKKFINLSVDGFPMYERGVVLGYILGKKHLREVLYSLDLDMPFTRKVTRYKAFFETNTISHYYEAFSFYVSSKKNLKCLLTLSNSDKCLGVLIKNLAMPKAFKDVLATQGIRMQENLLRFPKELELKENFSLKSHFDASIMEKMYKNFEYDFLTFVKNNPKTEFKLIIPPATRIYFRIDRLLKDKIVFLKKLAKNTSKYKNLKIYFFQNDDFTSNWRNFTYDLRHYPQVTNKLQIDAVLAGTHILNAKNVDKVMAKFLQNISKVDLRQLQKYFVSGEVNNQK